jgi:hypothetical protein
VTPMPSIAPASILAVQQAIRQPVPILAWERMQARTARTEACRDVLQEPRFYSSLERPESQSAFIVRKG